MAEMAASRSRSRVAAKRAASAGGLSVFSPAATLSGLGGIKFFWKWFLANPGFLIEKLGQLVNRALLKDRDTVQLEWPLTLPRRGYSCYASVASAGRLVSRQRPRGLSA